MKKIVKSDKSNQANSAIPLVEQLTNQASLSIS